MLEKKDELITKLEIEHKVLFTEWVKSIQSITDRDELYIQIHKNLHTFIANHKRWPSARAGFRKYKFDQENPRIKINHDALKSLKTTKETIGAETYSEVIILLTDNVQLTTSSNRCDNIWRDFTNKNCGQLYSSLYSEQKMKRDNATSDTLQLMRFHISEFKSELSKRELQEIFNASSLHNFLSELEAYNQNNEIIVYHAPTRREVFSMRPEYDTATHTVKIMHKVGWDIRDMKGTDIKLHNYRL